MHASLILVAFRKPEPLTPTSPSPTAAAALSKGFLDELRAGMDEQEGNDLEIDAVLWVDGAKTLNDPDAFANSCFLYDGVSEMEFDTALLGADSGNVVAGNVVRVTEIRVKSADATPRVALDDGRNFQGARRGKNNPGLEVVRLRRSAAPFSQRGDRSRG